MSADLRARCAALFGLLLVSGCGGATAVPTAPTATVVDGSPLATNYLAEVVGIMQNNSINRGQINWTDFTAQVFARAQGARTIPDTYPAISLALGLLNDHHSFFVTPSNWSVQNPSGKPCSAQTASTPAMPADVGYVRIATFAGADASAVRAFADSIQRQIRDADAATLVGWIVDVRGNLGGSMWPMVAGIGPVLGDSVAAYFVYPGASSVACSYVPGSALSGGSAIAQTTTVYELIRRAPKVAVLTDSLVASSGEAVVVSFRARTNTGSFGGPTCGLSTSNQTYRLSDGAMLYLTTALMADRNRTPYGDAIAPDETVDGDAEIVQRAIAWLRARRMLG